MANLTDEDREILDAVAGRSERQAAEYLGIPWSTFYGSSSGHESGQRTY
jgi:hypothetical protein